MTTEQLAQRKAELRRRYADLLPEPDYMAELYAGWLDIVEDALALIRKTNEKKNENGRVIQIKEKFGSLRIYTDGSSAALGAITDRANETCMSCGAPGEIRTVGNMYASACCDKCFTLKNAVAGADFYEHLLDRINAALLAQVDLSDLSLPKDADLEHVLTAIERAQVQKEILAQARKQIAEHWDTLEALADS